jgi:hypothetical protein
MDQGFVAASRSDVDVNSISLGTLMGMSSVSFVFALEVSPSSLQARGNTGDIGAACVSYSDFIPDKVGLMLLVLHFHMCN